MLNENYIVAIPNVVKILENSYSFFISSLYLYGVH